MTSSRDEISRVALSRTVAKVRFLITSLLIYHEIESNITTSWIFFISWYLLSKTLEKSSTYCKWILVKVAQEFLRILQKRKICKTWKRNFQNGHIIMLKAQCHRNHSPVAYIIETFADKQINMVLFEQSDWSLEVKKNAQRELIRPITKIVLLVEHDSPTESQGVNHN